MESIKRTTTNLLNQLYFNHTKQIAKQLVGVYQRIID